MKGGQLFLIFALVAIVAGLAGSWFLGSSSGDKYLVLEHDHEQSERAGFSETLAVKPEGSLEASRTPILDRVGSNEPGSLRVELVASQHAIFSDGQTAARITLSLCAQEDSEVPSLAAKGAGPIHDWSSLAPGSYTLSATIVGAVGKRLASLTDLSVVSGKRCSDPRLSPWDPFSDLCVMLLRIEDEADLELVGLEIGLAIDGVVQTRKPDDPWSVYPVIEPAHDGARILISAAHRRDESLPFVPGLQVIVLRRSILPTFNWVGADGKPIDEGVVTVERVGGEGLQLRPFVTQLDLSARNPIVLLPSAGRYRVVDEAGVYTLGEFEVPDEPRPKMRVVLN